jgi:hypothetical protein
MALRPPSLQRDYDEYYSGDPAFVQPPDDATKEQLEAHADRIRVARETGDWRPLLIDGQNPTTFVMKPLDGHIYRAIMDKIQSGEIGLASAPAFFFRAAIRKIVNLDGPTDTTFKFVNVAGVGSIAPVDIADKLDAIDKSIVVELGDRIFSRAQAPAPKS